MPPGRKRLARFGESENGFVFDALFFRFFSRFFEKKATDPLASYARVPWETSFVFRVAQIRVTGNNRTKPGVIGLRGVVKKAVGLGGWHWLRLENGAECRLQRNALAVVAPPTGLEMDSESDDDDVPPNAGYGRGAGGGRAGVGIGGMNDETKGPQSPMRGDDDAFGGRPRRASRPPKRVANEERPRRRDGGNSRGAHEPSVRFDKLRTETLEKIKEKHYKIPRHDDATDSQTATDKTTSGLKREERFSYDDDSRPEKRALVETIAKRFTSETVDETKVLIAFVKALAGGELPSPEPSGRDA